VIENEDMAFHVAAFLKDLTQQLDMPFIFKASYDKANRTSINAFRGPGITEGLNILKQIKANLDLCILSDVHRISEVERAAEILDVIQIPAFLCRQTDFITEVAQTGKTVNIKKGQFLAPGDIQNVVDKILNRGNDRILITERGTLFGYHNLVVDFRGIQIMHRTGYPVIFDATHSVQLPGGAGTRSAGDRAFASPLACAAVASGADGIFMEVHPEPKKALCDGPNSLKLDTIGELLQKLKRIRQALV
jgi:2-dehydro-3-deoxyphosphooctonate aldolase (KDO 8-P synthase)